MSMLCRRERMTKKQSGEERDVDLGSSGVCRSVGRPHSSARAWKTKKSASFPAPPVTAIFENGLELGGRTPLAEKPCRSFSSGQRQQLYEHESPGETALLTSYLLGSSEGGTNSPFNLTGNPP